MVPLQVQTLKGPVLGSNICLSFTFHDLHELPATKSSEFKHALTIRSCSNFVGPNSLIGGKHDNDTPNNIPSIQAGNFSNITSTFSLMANQIPRYGREPLCLQGTN